MDFHLVERIIRSYYGRISSDDSVSQAKEHHHEKMSIL